MRKEHLLSGAILLLAVGLILNAIALFAGRGNPPLRAPMMATPAHAISDQPATNYYLLGRDTYLLTASADGSQVFLWYYDHSPQKGNTSIEFIRKSIAPR